MYAMTFEALQTTSDIDDFFDQFVINLSEYHFDRDEANER